MAERERQGSAQVFDVRVERGRQVALRDGVLLATDLYLPVAAPPGPTLVERTPYGKTTAHLVATARFFARRGYPVVLQDVRGRGDSDGEWYPFALEGPDGYDTLAWIAAQPWCNGRVGTIGLSYTGSNQHALANLAPPALAAMFVSEGMRNYHTGSMRQGGAMEMRFFIYAFHMAVTSPEARRDRELRRLLEEARGAIRTWLGQAPLRPAASPLRHLPSYERWLLDVVSHGEYDDYWKQYGYNVEEHVDQHADVPIHFLSGWYDSYSRAIAENFADFSARKRGPVRLIIGPWIHGVQTMHQTWSGDVDFGPDAALDSYDDLRLRWFDRHLKGLDTGVDDEPAVRLFVMGGGSGRRDDNGRLDHGGQWRSEPTWPLARARPTPYYFHGDGSLGPTAPGPDGGATCYRYDPADPVPTVGGNISVGFEVMPGGAFDQRCRPGVFGCADGLPLAQRSDVVVFQTEPLAADVEVTGPVTVRLWGSSSAVDTDFTAKLLDVYPASPDYPDGYALNLVDGIIRARYRDARETPTPLEPHTVYLLAIELYPTSNVFARGHRIRVDVSSSNFPRFDVNPNTGEPLGRSRRRVVADNTVYHDARHPSHIVLPVVTGAPG